MQRGNMVAGPISWGVAVDASASIGGRRSMKPGIQVPVAVVGGWLTLMALLASRRRGQSRRSDAGESAGRAPSDTPTS